MDTAMHEALQAAAETGEVLTVCYNAGSRPGEARALMLLQIDGPNIGAKEPGGRRKLYKLEQVAWVEFSDGRRFVNADAPPPGPAKVKKAPPPLSPAEEAQHQRLKEAIAKGQTLHIEMGSAWDENMEEVPWHGFIVPSRFVNHASGVRVVCEMEPEGIYFASTEDQAPGRRHLPLGSFSILGVSDRTIDPYGGLVIDAFEMLRELNGDAKE
ncbi:hypothetical protein [Thauera butanivorans]|uniref:hypothetical protein n=1 Tax=Thauera butanivorans TaxID=86174 RepID=UPI000838E5F5|nr:hypothetical protein [Thauera butanivorans]